MLDQTMIAFYFSLAFLVLSAFAVWEGDRRWYNRMKHLNAVNPAQAFAEFMSDLP